MIDRIPSALEKVRRPEANATTLSEILDLTRTEEQRRALRALLMHPILFVSAISREPGTGGGSQAGRRMEENFMLVRRHQVYLTNWFARYTGWTLILRSTSARLVKRTADVQDATRGAVDPGSTGSPLSRERYVLWCLALMVLHQERRQTTLQRLADGAVRLANALPELTATGLSFNLTTATARRAIVCVVRMLLGYGILRRVEGDEAKFGEAREVDCLYDIDGGLLTDILYLPRPIASETRTESADDGILRRFEFAFPLRATADDTPLRGRELEHRLIGQLLDNPVLYFDELTEHEYQYWQSQRPRLLQVIEEATGLTAELRSEGVAILDAEGDLTDVKMPDSGTIGHATLLMGEFLAEQLRRLSCSADISSPLVLSLETLQAHLASLTNEHSKHWRKGITAAGQSALLLEEVLDRLEMLRLIRRTRAGVSPLPAVCRFAAERNGAAP